MQPMLLLTLTLLIPVLLANPIHNTLPHHLRSVSETWEIITGPSDGALTTTSAPCSNELPSLTTITDIDTQAWTSGCTDCYPPISETWTIATSELSAFSGQEAGRATILTPDDTFSVPTMVPPAAVRSDATMTTLVETLGPAAGGLVGAPTLTEEATLLALEASTFAGPFSLVKGAGKAAKRERVPAPTDAVATALPAFGVVSPYDLRDADEETSAEGATATPSICWPAC
ncbi:MAG: hypothetical protein M1822_000889 [Bathelium mastoideum]|nr:MAG: hypothetical protein M1822_000889 [Bathelium mastoideum]